jgi:hypothetical protein
MAIAIVVGAAAGPAAAALSETILVSPDPGQEVPLSASDGPTVLIAQDRSADLSDPFPDSNTVRLRTTDGNITFSSEGATTAQPDVIEGEWTNVSQINATSNSLKIDPGDKQSVIVEGDVDSINVSEVSVSSLDDGEADLIYSGTGGSANITVGGLGNGQKLVAVDLADGSILASATSNRNGFAEFSGLPLSTHKVDLRIQQDPPYVQSQRPSGGEYVTNRNVTLNAVVEDPAGGDLNVKVYHRNASESSFTLAKTTTVSSGTNVTADVDAAPGDGLWYVALESQHDGETADSRTYRFRAPGRIKVVNGSNGALLNTTEVEYSITATEEDYQRLGNTTTGYIDLKGVPETQLRVEIRAQDFENRTLVIDDPSSSPSALMEPSPGSGLSGEKETYTQFFALDDRTGNYPAANTVLVISQYLNGSWTEIASEEFGSQNLIKQSLSDGNDYRLRIRNGEGNIRELSIFEGDTTLENETVTLTVETVEPGDGSFGDLGYAWDASFRDEEGQSPFIRYQLDTRNETSVDNLRVVIYEQGNETNEIYNNSFGLANSVQITQPLTDDQSNKTWIVAWSGDVEDDPVQGSRVVGSFTRPSLPIDDFWLSAGSFVLLVSIGGLFGGIRAEIGAVVVALLGSILWFIGALPGAVAGGAVVAAMAVAIFFKVRVSRGPA